MLVSTPFLTDFIDYDDYIKVVSLRGQCDGHVLLVVAQRQDEEAAMAFSVKFGKLFSDTKVKIIDAVREGALVGVSNALFKAAMYYFRDYQGPPGQQQDVPMLYNDPTWHPHKRQWLDAIQAEYFAKGCPRVLTRWKANDRGDKITRGPVLFSKEYSHNTPLLPHIPAMVHWRTYLRHEIAQVAVLSDTISSGVKSVIKPYRNFKKK